MNPRGARSGAPEAARSRVAGVQQRWFYLRARNRTGSTVRPFSALVAEGVKATFARRVKGGAAALQNLSFDSARFTTAQAEAWRRARGEDEIARLAKITEPVYLRFVERVSGEMGKPVVDRTAHMIRGVKLIGSTSKNRRRYGEAIPNAVGLYEGAWVHINHPRDKDGNLLINGPDQVETRFAQVENAELRNGVDGPEVWGDLNYNPHHIYAEQLLWWAEEKPNAIMLSHRFNGTGMINPTDGWVDVTSIDQVVAVDLVCEGGTTNGLAEDRESDAGDAADDGAENTNEGDDARELSTLETRAVARLIASGRDPETARAIALAGAEDDTADDRTAAAANTEEHDDMKLNLAELSTAAILEARPDLVDAVKATLAGSEEVTKLRTDNAAQAKKITELEAKVEGFEAAKKTEEKRARVRTLAVEKLGDAKHVSAVFLEALVNAESDERVAALIEDRRTVLGLAKAPTSNRKSATDQAGGEGATSGGEGSAAAPLPKADAFVGALLGP